MRVETTPCYEFEAISNVALLRYGDQGDGNEISLVFSSVPKI